MVTDNPQRTMIMTHHQLFSAYENGDGVGKILKSKLGGLLKAGNIKRQSGGMNTGAFSISSLAM